VPLYKVPEMLAFPATVKIIPGLVVPMPTLPLLILLPRTNLHLFPDDNAADIAGSLFLMINILNVLAFVLYLSQY